jgi:hypothetical protein
MHWVIAGVIIVILAFTWWRGLPYSDFGSPEENANATLIMLAIAGVAIYMAIREEKKKRASRREPPPSKESDQPD